MIQAEVVAGIDGEAVPLHGRIERVGAVGVAGGDGALAAQRVVGGRGQAGAPLDRRPEADLADRVQALLSGSTATDGVPLDALETALVRSALASTQGNQSAAARLLGLSRAQLIYRMKALRPGSHG